MARPGQRRITVLGCTGMLGGVMTAALRSLGHDVRGMSRAMFHAGIDPLDRIGIESGDWVINAAGIINRRMLTPQGRAEGWTVNAEFPHVLAAYCDARDVPLIHVSTDCVFHGADGPYDESSPIEPNDEYGRSKAHGEPSNCLVLRTSLVGPEIHHGYSLLCWFLAQTEGCRGFLEHYWNGVTSLQFAKCVSAIITKDLYDKRIQHLFGEDTTKYHLLCAFADVFDKRIEVIPDHDNRRDTRLRTIYSDELSAVATDVPPMRVQLEEIRPFCDSMGRWTPAGRQNADPPVSE